MMGLFEYDDLMKGRICSLYTRTIWQSHRDNQLKFKVAGGANEISTKPIGVRHLVEVNGRPQLQIAVVEGKLLSVSLSMSLGVVSQFANLQGNSDFIQGLWVSSGHWQVASGKWQVASESTCMSLCVWVCVYDSIWWLSVLLTPRDFRWFAPSGLVQTKPIPVCQNFEPISFQSKTYSDLTQTALDLTSPDWSTPGLLR